MSRRGGVWDEMKRTISWTVERLDPGQALEVQLQFECMDNGAVGGLRQTPKFPVLVRADCPTLFSSIDLNSDYSDGLHTPVKVRVHASGRILHRKV